MFYAMHMILLVVNMISLAITISLDFSRQFKVKMENEYGNMMSTYGDAGKADIDWQHGRILQCWGCMDLMFKNWGGKYPHRIAKDVAYAAARKHCQPKWGHLKKFHRVLKSMENTLTNRNVSKTDFVNSVKATLYATNDSSSCFLSNANTTTTTDAQVTFRGNTHTVPAWQKIAEDEPMALKWVWRAKNIDDALLGKVNVSAYTLNDQKRATDDSSDYPWHITRLVLDQNDPVWSDDMPLRINGTSHTTFKAPLRSDPIVVDLQGMGGTWQSITGECGSLLKEVEKAIMMLCLLYEVESCSIDISKKIFGPTSCRDMVKRLTVDAVCEDF
ncbi:hypothetical protein VNO77_22865 [Canavalia gladiata]|uniref:Uncharacterized protein n=1 Tax=Canavalia gladiata TaxID=3824 RepID=A0AAN9QAZ5_CANGL